MPQRFKFKGLVVVFLLFFLLRNAAADDLNPNLRDLDDCKNGERGNIEIDIIDPDNSDNFDPGEIVDVEIDVRNRGDRTRNIIVEASLYNIDEEKTVEQEDSEEETLSPNEEDEFNIELEIPRKSTSLDDDDRFILFIKAFQEDNENEACGEEFIDLDLDLENEDVNVDSLKLLPSIVECGKSSTLIVEVNNIGKEELEDVKIKASNSRLSLLESSSEFDLDEFGEEDDEFIAKLDLDIPEEIDSGVYTINVDVLFEGESESDNINLEVICAENEKETNKKKAKEGGILFIAQSNMPSKDIRDIEVLDTGSTFTLLLFDIVLFLILIFLLLMIVRD